MLEATTKLCKSKTFQDLIEWFFTEMLSKFEGEEFWDTLRIMKMLCTNPNIVKNPAVPHPLRMGRDGVPVCLLMFVMENEERPGKGTRYYKLRVTAMNLLHEFWEVMGELKDEGYSATFEDVTETQKNLFVEEAMEFAKEYMKCMTDDVYEAKTKLNREIPALYTRFEDSAATDEDRMNFLEAKAVFFGLYGFPLSVVELARLRVQAATEAAAAAGSP